MKDLFGVDTNEWINDVDKEYVNMPEYNNTVQDEPEITATFKFRNREDFEEFKEHVKEHLYYNERVFDGMQKKTVKSAWYPLNEKPSKYKYE